MLSCARAVVAQEGGAQAEAPREIRLLTFRSEAVDGVDDLVLQGRTATIEHIEWQPMLGVDIAVEAAAPHDGRMRIVVRNPVGRPRVRVVQAPSDGNDYTLRVRIDDGPESGAAPLSFELWAVPRSAAPRDLDVVFITIDSLRPDHLGAYGYERATSPNLDLFARSAVRFSGAYSTSSFTPPAHASLLTSRQVGDHGLLTWNPLPEDQLTLAEVLAEHGYRTGASVNLGLLSGQNLGQGFEWRREGDREARKVVDDALEFLRADDGRPYFFWLHLYDVHRPYGRVAGWTDRFTAAPRPGIGDVEEHYNLKPEDVQRRHLGEADLAYLVDRYDAGIAYADAQLGPLLAELSTPAHSARTLIVITADHGESLLDHPERLFSHDPFLFAAVTHVPLFVRNPDGQGAGSVRGDLVSIIDCAPTVLALLSIDAPKSFAGRSLRVLEAGASFPEREIYQECWGWSRFAAARTSAWLALCDVSSGETRIFDLAADPGERLPLVPPSQPAVQALVAHLQTFAHRSAADAKPPGLDPEVLRRLRGLGYTDR